MATPLTPAAPVGPVFVANTVARFTPLSPDPAQRGRVELRKPRIDQLITTKGYRLAWSRAAECPCTPVDAQLDEPSPNCRLCEGSGLFYFGTDNAAQLAGEDLSPVQLAIVRRTRSAVIRGMMSGLSANDTMTDRMGEWRHGAASLTVLAENRIAFRDRLVNLDAKIMFREVVKMPAETQVVPLRYVVNDQVVQVRSTERPYLEGAHWSVNAGVLRFHVAPPPGTRLSVNYLTCPTWLVTDQPHVERLYNPRRGVVRGLRGRQAAKAAKAQPQQLPLQAMVQLQFIPHTSVAAGGAS